MRKKKLAPQALQSIFNREWKRAKRMCKPFFDSIRKPRLYVTKTLPHGWLGYHSGRNGMTMHKINGRWVSGDIIVIREDHTTSPDLINTLRHEICHVKHHNHKGGFKAMLRGLNEKAPSPENA